MSPKLIPMIMKWIRISLFMLMLSGYLFWGLKWGRSYLLRKYVDSPGERPGFAMQGYPSPDGNLVARVRFKVMRSDDHVDNFDLWVEVGPTRENRGTPVITLFRSTCVSCEWLGNDRLLIYYWGEINRDYKVITDVDGIKVELVEVKGPRDHNPSKTH